jgi:Astacin (Peptidase family M12A)
MRVTRVVVLIGMMSFVACELATAHDGRGPNMGFAPGERDMEQTLAQLIPAGLGQEAADGIKGVINRAEMWPQNQELIICFLSGTPKARARVATAAVEWMNYVNLRLNFGDMSSPRDCSGTGQEHIKIDFKEFGPQSGNWSYVGIVSWRFTPSMNLEGLGQDEVLVADSEFRGIVLHEFGHALGFEHEHQSPAAKCDQEFDSQALAAWAAREGWTSADVKRNLQALQPTKSLEFTRHDTKSIMHYSLPPEIFRGGKDNRCWVPPNYELSEGDRKFAASMYPPRSADVPTGVRLDPTSTAPQDRQKLESDYRVQLQASFERLLGSHGMSVSQRQEAIANFEKEVAKLRDGPSRH